MVDRQTRKAYYNSNRTPHTSHVSDVPHGETFYILERGKGLQLKPPTTFEQQMELIKTKGFLVPENQEAECIAFLQRTNYYRLSAYFLPFRKKDGTFLPNISFSQVQKIYEFDSSLRGLLFTTIEDIEVNLRTQLAYYVAHKYNALAYLEEGIFSEKHNKEKFEAKVRECIDENRSSLVVKHHKKNYENQFPIWVIIEFFSMGMLSYFYSDMLTEDKKAIASKFKTRPKELESWLRCLTDLRNRCAHYSRLYYWIFTALPKTPVDASYTVDRKLFTQLMILKSLYPLPSKWNVSFVLPLRALIDEYEEYISLKHIGFPVDWETILSN